MNVINNTQLLEIHGGASSGSITTIVKHLHHAMIVQEAVNYFIGFCLNGPAADDYIGQAAVSFFTTCTDNVMAWTSGSHCE